MERFPIASTNVASIGYDEQAAILEVEFVKGGIYQYFGIPRDLYEEFLASPSKGAFINTRIRGVFAHAKVG